MTPYRIAGRGVVSAQQLPIRCQVFFVAILVKACFKEDNEGTLQTVTVDSCQAERVENFLMEDASFQQV